MELDKRPRNVWIVAVLADFCLAFSLSFLVDSIVFSGYYLNPLTFFLVLGFSSLITILPVAISGMGGGLKKILSLGFLVSFLIPIPSLIHFANTCSGKFCGFIELFLAYALGFSAIVFVLLYAIGIYGRKWAVGFSRFLIWVFGILFVGSVISFCLGFRT